ncbi:amidohydrolase family protein [uncultured Sphingomonas sp.]|uniref:amidohydrolase family protein n=1 Tax=uncultured Sphingomonas sp. TaxID=158754 RepID=UPI0035CADE20
MSGWRRGVMTAGALSLAAGAQAQARQLLVLDGVTVVDTRSGALSPRRAVVIEGDRIVRIAAAGSVKAAPGVRTIVARGKYVVPGYLDMHAHPLTTGSAAGDLRVMLSLGVTGYRQMNGSPELLAQRAAGTLSPPGAPTLLALSGTILAGPPFATPELAVAEIRRQKAAGADFIKAIDLPPPALFAAYAEAKADGLSIAGHLSPLVDVRQAAARGMNAIEHLGPRESILLGCSSAEAALRADPPSAPQRPQGAPAGPPPPAVMARMLVNPIAFTTPDTFRRYARVLDTYDAAKCRELAGEFARYGTWQTPTLIRLRTMELGDDPAYVNDPNLRYVARPNRELWASVAKQFQGAIGAPARAELARLFAAQLALTKLFYDTHVPMMAGSDLGGGFVVAGYGLHQELDLLAQAGLPPLAVLQMTTLNGAKYLHREATMGSVDAGKVADLVVLDGNPIASVANLHRIDAVVHDGRYYTADDLAALRRQTEQESR